MDRTQRDGVLFILLSTTGFAFFAVLVKTIQTYNLPSFDIAFWRYIMAAPLMWAIIVLRRSPAPERPLPRLSLLALGALWALAALAGISGMEYIDGGLYVVLFYTYPAMVALLTLLLGERLPTMSWIALALTLVGIGLTIPDSSRLAADNRTLTGILIALFNAFVIAIYFVWSNRILRGHKAYMRSSAWVINGALLLLFILLPFTGVHVPAQPEAWFLLLALAIIVTVLAILFLNMGIQKLGPSQAAIMGTLEPVLAMILTYIFLGERLQPPQILGGALIVISVVLLQLGGRVKHQQAAYPSA